MPLSRAGYVAQRGESDKQTDRLIDTQEFMLGVERMDSFRQYVFPEL
jgi:hypothetical protein